MTRRRLAVVSGGLREPSSTRLLADQLAAATEDALREVGIEPEVELVELREHAHDITNNVLTGFPGGRLREVLDTLAEADGLIAVTPVFNASYSGLFKMFFDVLDEGSLAGTPVLMGATAGTARHSLVLEHAMRPVFTYLKAIVVPTGVFAASEDWGAGGGTSALSERVERAGRELAGLMAARQVQETVDPYANVTPFEQLLA